LIDIEEFEFKETGEEQPNEVESAGVQIGKTVFIEVQ